MQIYHILIYSEEERKTNEDTTELTPEDVKQAGGGTVSDDGTPVFPEFPDKPFMRLYPETKPRRSGPKL